jgi:hypothetical protein
MLEAGIVIYDFREDHNHRTDTRRRVLIQVNPGTETRHRYLTARTLSAFVPLYVSLADPESIAWALVPLEEQDRARPVAARTTPHEGGAVVPGLR